MNELFNEFVHEHRGTVVLMSLLLVLAIIAGIGTYWFDWDLIQMAMDAKDTVTRWVYTPFNRSFEGLKEFSAW